MACCRRPARRPGARWRRCAETAGVPAGSGAPSGALHSRDGTSSRPQTRPARAGDPAGSPRRGPCRRGPRTFSRAPVRARAFAAASARTAGIARARATSRSINARAVRWRPAAACGRRARSAPASSLLTRQSVRTLNHLLSRRRLEFLNQRGVGAGWPAGAVAFHRLFQSVCANRRRGFANFGVNPISRSIFAPSPWETVGHSAFAILVNNSRNSGLLRSPLRSCTATRVTFVHDRTRKRNRSWRSRRNSHEGTNRRPKHVRY